MYGKSLTAAGRGRCRTQENVKVPARETMTIVTQLPDDYAESTLAIRSSLQSIVFYVGGELRAGYDTSHTRLVGKNSASGYVFCPTSAADAGKEVRMEN